MSLVEFIGFVISMAALIFLFFKRVSEERYRRQHPEEIAEEEHEKELALKEFMKTMHIDIGEEEKIVPPPKPVATHPSRPPAIPIVKKNIPPKQAKRKEEKEAFKPTYDREHDDFEKRLLSKSFHKKSESSSAYEVKRLIYNSRGNDLIEALPSKRDMLIYREIFDKPLALRIWDSCK